ncbi:anti-sigma factor [Streptomyces rimosus]|uniref:anti-sigma factor family protein n=1 Tax=Streptomyces rimosus TaxID=1927 RepID=UPI0004CA5851|nr:membrane protein [Streptomyces rimosus]
MTSTTDTDEHPEVSEISALTDGLLSPSRTADLRDHLACCELCEDVHASLEEIRGLLGTLPGPTRMPADVAERIDAALAAEALLDSTAPDHVPDVSRETSQVAAAVSRETEPAPTASPSGPVTRPSGHPRAATGPGRRTTGARSRSRRWPRALLGAAAAAAVLSVGGVIIQNISSGSGQSDGQKQHSESTKHSAGASSALTSATLEARVHSLLTASGSKKTPDVGTQSSPDTPLRGATDAVPSCVQRGTGRTEAPLASARSSYEGQDAYLVVLPHPTDPSRVSAYVIASSCVSASPPAPGKVLLTHSYRRD